MWVLLLLLQPARAHHGNAYSKQDDLIIKEVASCPDEGYFFRREPSLNGVFESCYLCFCQSDGQAFCWLRQNRQCDTKHYHHLTSNRAARSKRSAGLAGIFLRDAARDAFNKQIPEQCRPFDSSYSRGCPPDDWCIGCTVCDCDANGRWDCHVMSFCGDGDSPSKTKDLNSLLPKHGKTSSSRKHVSKKNSKRESLSKQKDKNQENFKNKTYKFEKVIQKHDEWAEKKSEIKKRYKNKKHHKQHSANITIGSIVTRPIEKRKTAKLSTKVSKKYLRSNRTEALTHQPNNQNSTHEDQTTQQSKSKKGIKRSLISQHSAPTRLPQRRTTTTKPKIPQLKKFSSKRAHQKQRPTKPKWGTEASKISIMKRQKLITKPSDKIFVKPGNKIFPKTTLKRNRIPFSKWEPVIQRVTQKSISKIKRMADFNNMSSIITELKLKNLNFTEKTKLTALINRIVLRNIHSKAKDKLSEMKNNLEEMKSWLKARQKRDTNNKLDEAENLILAGGSVLPQTPQTIAVTQFPLPDASISDYSVKPISTTVMDKNITVLERGNRNSTYASDVTTQSNEMIISLLNDEYLNGNVTYSISDEVQNNYTTKKTEKDIAKLVPSDDQVTDRKISINVTQILKVTTNNIPYGVTVEPNIDNSLNVAINSPNTKKIQRLRVDAKSLVMNSKGTQKHSSRRRKTFNGNYCKNKRRKNYNVDKLDDFKNFLNQVLGTLKQNASLSSKLLARKQRVSKYLKNYFVKLIRKHESKKVLRYPVKDRSTLDSLCKYFGPCNFSYNDLKAVETKIDIIDREAKVMVNNIKRIKTLLKYLNGNKKSNLHDDIHTIFAIIKERYHVNGTVLSKHQKEYVETIKIKTNSFIRSASKFAIVFNDIVELIMKSKAHAKSNYQYQNLKTTLREFNNSQQRFHFRKLVDLFLRYNMLQNTMMTKIYKVLEETKIIDQNENKENKSMSNHTEAIQEYTMKIIENLRKLKSLAERINTGNSTRRKRETKHDESIEYMLMLIQYLMKKHSTTDDGKDGIDLLIDAIREAPDIRYIKNTFLQSLSDHNASFTEFKKNKSNDVLNGNKIKFKEVNKNYVSASDFTPTEKTVRTRHVTKENYSKNYESSFTLKDRTLEDVDEDDEEIKGLVELTTELKPTKLNIFEREFEIDLEDNKLPEANSEEYKDSYVKRGEGKRENPVGDGNEENDETTVHITGHLIDEKQVLFSTVNPTKVVSETKSNASVDDALTATDNHTNQAEYKIESSETKINEINEELDDTSEEEVYVHINNTLNASALKIKDGNISFLTKEAMDDETPKKSDTKENEITRKVALFNSLERSDKTEAEDSGSREDSDEKYSDDDRKDTRDI